VCDWTSVSVGTGAGDGGAAAVSAASTVVFLLPLATVLAAFCGGALFMLGALSGAAVGFGAAPFSGRSGALITMNEAAGATRTGGGAGATSTSALGGEGAAGDAERPVDTSPPITKKTTSAMTTAIAPNPRTSATAGIFVDFRRTACDVDAEGDEPGAALSTAPLALFALVARGIARSCSISGGESITMVGSDDADIGTDGRSRPSETSSKAFRSRKLGTLAMTALRNAMRIDATSGQRSAFA
jgi:hypothetical protein